VLLIGVEPLEVLDPAPLARERSTGVLAIGVEAFDELVPDCARWLGLVAHPPGTMARSAPAAGSAAIDNAAVQTVANATSRMRRFISASGEVVAEHDSKYVHDRHYLDHTLHQIVAERSPSGTSHVKLAPRAVAG
jgi:hypothetical protein